MLERKITLLNFDETVNNQSLLDNFPADTIDCSLIPSTQGYCSFESLNEIRKRISNRLNPVTYIGNGNYHYVSYLLLERIKKPFSLLLFDHHADMASNDIEGIISCGSWVSYALETLPYLEKVVIVGTNEKIHHDKVLTVSEEEVDHSYIQVMKTKITGFIKESPLYISVDKDVLYEEDAKTNWDHGSLSLLQLIYFIREMNQTNEIIGMDICGELPTIGQSFLTKEVKKAIKKNEIANRAILDIIK